MLAKQADVLAKQAEEAKHVLVKQAEATRHVLDKQLQALGLAKQADAERQNPNPTPANRKPFRRLFTTAPATAAI